MPINVEFKEKEDFPVHVSFNCKVNKLTKLAAIELHKKLGETINKNFNNLQQANYKICPDHQPGFGCKKVNDGFNCDDVACEQ